MKTLKASLLVLSLALVVQLPSANAAVKAGATCAKIGQLSPTKSPKFKCQLVSGKKKWVATKTKSELVRVPASWPLTQPANSVEEILAIADSAERKYTAGVNEVLPVELLIGPNTSKTLADLYIQPLKTAMVLWSKDFKPTKPLVVALAEVQDYEFMKEQWQKNEFGSDFDSSKETWNRNGENCNQGAAKNDPQPFFWGCIASNAGGYENIGIKKFTPHEYAHVVQIGLFKEASGGKFGNVPSLFSEGSADYYGVTYASTASDAAKNWQRYRASKYQSSETINGLLNATNDQMYSYLVDAMKDSKLLPGHWYFTGAYATARLVAAKGHDGFVDFLKENGKLGGGDVFKAFQNVYGITFEEFAKMISPEVIKFAKN
ncbi:hypothetical protein MCEMRE26_01339 [Candidatus Nanopelagicaceae bacterium]